jgi:hypothetical protein
MTNANPPGWPPQGQPGFTAAPIQQARKQRGRGLKIVGLIAYGIVVLIIGIAIGSAGKPATSTAASTKSTTPSTTTQNTPTPTATTPAAAAPANQVLIRFAGSGIKNSAPFSVGNGPLTITYRFDCSNFGQSGNFQADLEYGNQSSLNSDDQMIANDLAMQGGQTTTVYPQDPGKDYYLSVNSECSWHLKVVGQ